MADESKKPTTTPKEVPTRDMGDVVAEDSAAKDGEKSSK